MKKRLIATAGAAVALAMLVPSAAYASTSTSSQQTLAVQAGTLSVSNTTPANITAQVDGTGSGALPSAEWGDLTGSGDGWQGSIAASNFIYTGNWSPVGSAPALSSDTSAGYTGTADGDTYTVTITSVSGSTIDFSYSSTNGASGTGTATAGTAADVGTNGLTITFSTSATYATGDAYQIEVGSQNPSAMTLNDSSSSATITPYDGATSTPPAYVNAAATVKGGGSTYGTAVPFLSAAQDTGMGEYTISPQAKVTTDLNSWAANYTSNVQYTISSGPYVSSGGSTSGLNAPPLLASPKVVATIDTVQYPYAIASSGTSIYALGDGAYSSTSVMSVINALTGTVDNPSNVYQSGVPGAVYYDGGVWEASGVSDYVTEVSPSTGAAMASINVGQGTFGITFGGGYIWAASSSVNSNSVYQINPSTDAVTTYTTPDSDLGGIVYENGYVWVVNANNSSVTELSASTGDVVNTIAVGSRPLGITYGNGDIWVANRGSNSVTQIDASTGAVINTIAAGTYSWFITYGNGSAWVSNESSGTVSEISGTTGDVVATISVGDTPAGVIDNNGYIWVADFGSNTVTEIES
jgi:YVTN family beta-propeller protein